MCNKYKIIKLLIIKLLYTFVTFHFRKKFLKNIMR